MTMKEDANLLAFMNAAKACTGEVFYKTDEGDILNLKSQLSQYIFLASAMAGKSKLPEGKIVCENSEDISVLLPYLNL